MLKVRSVGIYCHFMLLEHWSFYGLIGFKLLLKWFYVGKQTTHRVLTYTIGKSIVVCILFYMHPSFSPTSVHPNIDFPFLKYSIKTFF